MQGRIAFFDSGVGGLALLAECSGRFPGEKYLYYGDNANAPYGNRGDREICALADRAFAEIARREIAAAVIACNTVTAECAGSLRRRYPFPIFGIEPAIRPAAAAGGKVLVLATRATLRSARVAALLHENETRAEIACFCSARLAGAVEAAAPDLSALRLEEHLPPGRYDGVVLGCTHYALIGRAIARYYSCPVYDGVAGTVDHLQKKLNIRSENASKRAKIDVIFAGSGKIRNETVFFGLK